MVNSRHDDNLHKTLLGRDLTNSTTRPLLVDENWKLIISWWTRTKTIKNVTTNYITNWEDIYSVDTSGVRILTLSIADCNAGRTIIIKDSWGNAWVNNITIQTEWSETIDWWSNYIITTNYLSINLYSDWSNWFIY